MFSTAEEVLEFIKDEDVKFVDVRFCDLPGVMQHFNVPGADGRRGLLHRRPDVRRLVDPRLPGHPRVRHEAHPGPHDAPTSTRSAPRRRSSSTSRSSTRSPTSPTAATRATSPPRPRRTCKSTGIADTAYFGAEAEFYIFDDVRFETKQNAGYYYIDSIEGAWNTGRVEEGGNRGYKTPLQGRLLPRPAGRPLRRPARRDVPRARRRRPRGRAQPPRGRHRRPGRRSTTASTRCCTPADDMMKFKYVVKNVAWERGQDRHLHAEAALRRQRLGHAHATSRCGRTASRCSTTSSATAACPTSPAGTSAACSSTPRRCSRSPTRR